MYKVKKRDGIVVDFDINKITSAITKAFEAQNKQYTVDTIDLIALKATADYEPKIKDGLITVEDVQDSVEKVLGQSGYSDVAKAYILYRKQREKLRNVNGTLVDYKKIVKGYLDKGDWRVKENSTVNYSVGGLILSNSGAITANYWLSEVYDEEVANAHRDGDIHIHDLSMLAPYCAGWSLRQLIAEGLGGVPGKISSAPAAHLSTLCNQMVNFLGILQNEWAGAQAFSSFDTYLAPFVRKDNLTYKEVKQCIQSFIYGVNVSSRWGCVPETTKILTPEGWKSRNELRVGDTIYTWVDGTLQCAKLKHIIYHKNDYGVMHKYKGTSYQQIVTPDHRCIVESGSKRGCYLIKQSMDIFGKRADVRMPVRVRDVNVPAYTELTDEEVMFAAIYYTDGTKLDNGLEITKSVCRDDGTIANVLNALGMQYTINEYDRHNDGNVIRRYLIARTHMDYVRELIGDKYNIDDKFLSLPYYQSKLFIDTWAAFDGSTTGRIMCQYDNEDIRQKLELIMIRAAYMPHKWSRHKDGDANPTNYLYADTKLSVVVQEQEEVPYNGMVWCPNTEDGTAIFKDADGFIFISGNCQAPFTNITLDWVCPPDLAELNCIVGGKEMPYRYKDCQKEMDMINKAFLEIMIEGDAYGRGFQYPIPTYSITKDFDWSETENNRLLFEMTAKYGTPYFSNYINSDMEPSDVRSMCCRLRLDLRELRKKSGGFFGSGESTGSVGVVTINMPRIAYLAENEEDFYRRLDHMMDIAARSLNVKRTVVTGLLEAGLYPYTKRYLGSLNNHFSTIGLVGMNEAGLNANWLRADMTHKETQQFTKNVLNHMRERLSDYQEKYGDLYNLEATPAESTSYRLAKHDTERYPDIITAAKCGGTPYYTNSSHLPVSFTADIFEALDIQDEIQTLYTSGTVFHAFLGEKLPDWKSAANLVRKIAENYRLPYYTLSPTYSVCEDHGYLCGEQFNCPECGKATEVYSRITGYYRPVQNWNDGKTQEYKERLEYNVRESVCKRNNEHKVSNEIDVPTIKECTAKGKIMLFATKTCPNCKVATATLEKKGIIFEKIYVEDHPDLAREYNIKQAPTAIVYENGVATSYKGIAEVLKLAK